MDAAPHHVDAGFERRTFSTMGTFGELLLRAEADAARDAFDAVEAELEEIVSAFTRFDPSSPIERLNDAGGGVASELMREVLVVALRAFADTGGRVDVGVGQHLLDAGYDRDFDLLDVPPAQELDCLVGPLRSADAGGWTTERVQEPPFSLDLDGVVRLRPRTRIDLGGIAKGWAADRLCRTLAPIGSCLVNLGGDIAVYVEPDTDPWPVGVELTDGDTATYWIAQGGLATSGQDQRRWRTPGSADTAHHLIDPRTGHPALSDVLRVTVFGATCTDAEVWTKALFLHGVDAACAEAERLGIPAIVVGMDGATRYVGVEPPV